MKETKREKTGKNAFTWYFGQGFSVRFYGGFQQGIAQAFEVTVKTEQDSVTYKPTTTGEILCYPKHKRKRWEHPSTETGNLTDWCNQSKRKAITTLVLHSTQGEHNGDSASAERDWNLHTRPKGRNTKPPWELPGELSQQLGSESFHT